ELSPLVSTCVVVLGAPARAFEIWGGAWQPCLVIRAFILIRSISRISRGCWLSPPVFLARITICSSRSLLFPRSIRWKNISTKFCQIVFGLFQQYAWRVILPTIIYSGLPKWQNLSISAFLSFFAPGQIGRTRSKANLHFTYLIRLSTQANCCGRHTVFKS